MSNALDYAPSEPAAPPGQALLYRLLVWVVLAAWIAELPVVVRPTQVAWERLWIFATLPLFGLALYASIDSFRRLRLLFLLALTLTLGACMLPIGEAWDAVTRAGMSSASFQSAMLAAGLATAQHVVTLTVLSATAVVVVTVLRDAPAATVRRVALIAGGWPSGLIVLLLLQRIGTQGSLVISTRPGLMFVAWGVALMLFVLPLVSARASRACAACLLVLVLIAFALHVLTVHSYANFSGAISEPRMLGNFIGPWLMRMAPALAVLLTRTK